MLVEDSGELVTVVDSCPEVLVAWLVPKELDLEVSDALPLEVDS